MRTYIDNINFGNLVADAAGRLRRREAMLRDKHAFEVRRRLIQNLQRSIDKWFADDLVEGLVEPDLIDTIMRRVRNLDEPEVTLHAQPRDISLVSLPPAEYMGSRIVVVGYCDQCKHEVYSAPCNSWADVSRESYEMLLLAETGQCKYHDHTLKPEAPQPAELTPIEELVNGLQRMIKDALDKEEARRELAAEEGGDK